MLGWWWWLWGGLAPMSVRVPCGHDGQEPDDRRAQARPLAEAVAVGQRLCAGDVDWFRWRPARGGTQPLRLEVIAGDGSEARLAIYAPRRRRPTRVRPDARGRFLVKVRRPGVYRLRLTSPRPLTYRLVPPLPPALPDDAPAGAD